MKNYQSLREITADLKSGSLTVTQLATNYIARIQEHKNLNAFLEVFEKSALLKAAEVDQKIKQGTAGKLAGMVIALKDNICYKDHKLSASSKILEEFTSLYNATVTERLLAADAVIIGRTNCDEFAMGSSNENSAFGSVLNPLDTTRVAGGSSGGSVAAVAADLCLAALGTDTGGSIRQPASFTGVVGFKPTYGRVSRYGAIAYASSFDQIGPITKSIEDCALIMEVISGADEYDATCSSKPVPNFSAELEKKETTLKIAYIKDCIERDGLDPEVKAKTLSVIEDLKKQGHTVEAVEFPYLDYMVPVYQVLSTAEASSNLARFDGVHYGYRSKNATDLDSTFKRSRSEGFGKEVQRRIMLGTFVLSSGYYDAYYAKGQKVRRLLQNKTNEILNKYDFILLPTTPATAFKQGKNSADPVAMYLEDIFTVQANITGMPAISIPVGKHSNGLPFGLQLIGRMFDDARLISFSKQVYQTSNDYHV